VFLWKIRAFDDLLKKINEIIEIKDFQGANIDTLFDVFSDPIIRVFRSFIFFYFYFPEKDNIILDIDPNDINEKYRNLFVKALESLIQEGILTGISNKN